MTPNSTNADSPYFSVIMNCHNGETYLRQAIDCVYAQDFDDWEIIFFDNASTDATAEIARSFDKRLKYFQSDEKISLGAARNKAINRAKGKFVVFLDSDDLWLPGKLTAQARALEKPSSGLPYGFCYTDAMRVDKDGKDILPYSTGRDTRQEPIFLALLRDCFIAMSSVAISRKVYLEMGGIDESLEMVEEWDLWLRTAKSYDLAIVPDILTKIRFHDANTTHDYKLQSQETLMILSRIQVESGMEREQKRILEWYKIRFALVDFVHKLGHVPKKSPIALLHLVGRTVRAPLVSLRMVRSYLTPDMLGFLRSKYFGRRK